MDFTTNEWVVVALVFVAGWLLGLLSAPKGDRWKRDYEAEREAHMILRRDYDMHMAKHAATRDDVTDRRL